MFPYLNFDDMFNVSLAYGSKLFWGVFDNECFLSLVCEVALLVSQPTFRNYFGGVQKFIYP